MNVVTNHLTVESCQFSSLWRFFCSLHIQTVIYRPKSRNNVGFLLILSGEWIFIHIFSGLIQVISTLFEYLVTFKYRYLLLLCWNLNILLWDSFISIKDDIFREHCNTTSEILDRIFFDCHRFSNIRNKLYIDLYRLKVTKRFISINLLALNQKDKCIWLCYEFYWGIKIKIIIISM